MQDKNMLLHRYNYHIPIVDNTQIYKYMLIRNRKHSIIVVYHKYDHYRRNFDI